MNDAYGWGIWKTFNVMVLTALGSGAFAVGIAAWVFRRKRLHVADAHGAADQFSRLRVRIALLGIDAGRPWNFYWIVFPWRWNMHSPLAEVAICMSIYAMIPLFLENIPPVLERLWYLRAPPRLAADRRKSREVLQGGAALDCEPGVCAARDAPVVAGRADAARWNACIPALADAVAAVALCVGRGFPRICLRRAHTSLSNMAWKRPLDMEILDEMDRITAWLIGCWLAFRTVDLTLRGQILTAFHFDGYALLFWLEIAVLSASVWMLRESVLKRSPRTMFYGTLLALAGGMIYRFARPPWHSNRSRVPSISRASSKF